MKKEIDKDTLEYIVANGKDKIFRCNWPIFLKLHEDISLEIYCLDESIEYYLNYISHEVKEFRRKVFFDDFDMFDASCEKKS